MSYSAYDYSCMIADRVRVEAYAEAMRRTVRPGSTVLDLGAGTGLFALLACRLGAAKVYAIEPNPAVHLAREMAADNGFEDRIEFFADLSTEVDLPTRADVIVSDLRGRLPLVASNIPSIIDARTRLLAPGGVLLPTRDTLYAAVVEAAPLYADTVERWASCHLDFDVQALRRTMANILHDARSHDMTHLTAPQSWGGIDYATVENTEVEGALRWDVETTATAHGLRVWFETEIVDGVGFSTVGDGRATIYGTLFFPFLEPVSVEAGDVIEGRLGAHLVGGEYLWRWDTKVLAGGSPDRARAAFAQSTLESALVDPRDLQRGAASHVPKLGWRGEADALILERMRRAEPLLQIAEALHAAHPQRYPSVADALGHVGGISRKYHC